tara:strand:- start:122 stop:421 length:300 start_codon:yes stop_codon:yes gene_type:complete
MANKTKNKLNSPYILNPNESMIPERTSVTYYDASKRKFVSIYFDLSVQEDMGDIESWIGKHASEIGLLANKLDWTANRVEDKNYVTYFKSEPAPANLPF